MIQEYTTRTRSRCLSATEVLPRELLTQERLLEFSDRCHLGFRPMNGEPLGEQRHRLVLALEDRISWLLSHLLELDPDTDDEEHRDA